MEAGQILQELDKEIARLTQVRHILAGGGENIPSLNKKRKNNRKPMSAEAREKIAAAQRKRWAAQKKATKKAA